MSAFQTSSVQTPPNFKATDATIGEAVTHIELNKVSERTLPKKDIKQTLGNPVKAEESGLDF